MRNIVVISVLAFVLCGCAGKEGRSEADLLRLYEKYHAEKNLDGMMSLFYQEGTPDFIVQNTKKGRKDSFNLTITAAQIVPVPPESKKEAMAGASYMGKVLVPNLEPLKQIEFKFDTSTQGNVKTTGEKIMFGKVGDTHYFIMSKFSTSSSSEQVKSTRQVGVSVMGVVLPDPVLFTGSCIYIVGGKERQMDVSGSGNISKAFNAEDLIRCKITQTSSHGSIQLTISVDGETIFESEESKGPETIVYQE